MASFDGDFPPLGSSDGVIDPLWLTSVLGEGKVKKGVVRGMETMGGMIGAFELLDVEMEDGRKLSLGKYCMYACVSCMHV